MATITIHLDTNEGPARVTSDMAWNDRGLYSVTGRGKHQANEWLQTTIGAFGSSVATVAAPCDLHYAALNLQSQPEDDISVKAIEADAKPYEHGWPEEVNKSDTELASRLFLIKPRTGAKK
jgi:hypothetical protein